MTYRRIIDTLNDLIQTCEDGARCFDACCEHTASTELRHLFTAHAQEYRNAARELKNLVVDHGGRPPEDMSTTNDVARGWVAALGTIAGDSDPRLLEAAERGENCALARYRETLANGSLPAPVRAVIVRQMAGIQRNHDEVKVLCDRVASSI